MKIVVNPLYTHLREFIGDIPNRNYKCDKVLEDRRNCIEKVTAPDGTKLVIKRYKRPTYVNQVVYTFMRWSKAKRSYMYAARLLEKNIQTPEQVAYIEVFKWGIFHTGYYITRYISDEPLTNISSFNTQEREAILYDLARFTYDLHLKGIKHGDYHIYNMFYRHENERYIFTLIDINRMEFRRKMTRKACVREFQWLLLNRNDLIIVAEQYAILRGWNIDLFCGAIFMKRGIDIKGNSKKVLNAIIRLFGFKGKKR
jgi:tRNA A-37 threonylcarbamoyl transferase component Bud32